MPRIGCSLGWLLPLVVACGGAVRDADGPEQARAPQSPPPTPTPTPTEASAPTVPEAPWAEIEDSPGAPELSAGAALIRNGKWVGARKELLRALSTLGEQAPRDAVAAGNALLGRAENELKDKAAAAKAYTAALDELKHQAGLDPERRRRLLSAAGEAIFFRAEQRRIEAEAIRMPAYQGKGDTESIRKHIDTKVVKWAKERRAALDEAEALYASTTTLEPTAPPRWVIRSAARSGQMWGRFVAEFRAAPIPNEWKQDGPTPYEGIRWEDVRASYYAALDEVSKPLLDVARARFERCQGDATKLGYHDDYTEHCDAWLSKQPR